MERKVTFREDWTVDRPGPLVAGIELKIRYALRRLKMNGEIGSDAPHNSTITGYCQLNAEPVQQFEMSEIPAGQDSESEHRLHIERPGILGLWFQRTTRYGEMAYDSDFGHNFRFVVYPRFARYQRRASVAAAVG